MILIIFTRIGPADAGLAGEEPGGQGFEGERKIMGRPYRTILMACAIIFLAGCFAQLTPQLLSTPYQDSIASMREFSDEFENPLHLGNRWQRLAGWWRIDQGMLFQTLRWKSSLPGEFQVVYVNGLASGAYTASTRLSFLQEGDQSAGILLRFQDQNNFYLLRLRHYPRWQDFADLTQYVSGVRREDLRRVELKLKPGDWYALRAEDQGNEIIAYLDQKELFRFPTPDRPMGTVGLAVKTGKVAFDHFSASLYDPIEEEPPLSEGAPEESAAIARR